MEQEILEIINKSLPTQMGSILKKRLEQADADKARLESCLRMIDNLKAQVEDVEKDIENYKGREVKQQELNTREEEIGKRERSMQVWEANLRGSEAEKRANEIAGFVGMVFKSPVFRKSVSGYQSVPNGQYGTIQQPHNHTEETTEE